jgi:hypothetical protein
LLKNLANPIQAGIALTALGTAIPCVPGALPAMKALINLEAMPWDAACWLVILCVSAAVLLICGFNGLRNRTDADELIAQIRKRRTIPLPPVDAA